MTIEPVTSKPEELHALRQLAALLEDRTEETATIAHGRRQAELPESVHALLATIAKSLAAGHALVVLSLDRELTTREAADILGISRPTLIKLLNAGEITYSRPNSSRRIPLEHVLAYKKRRSYQRRKLLAELTSGAVDLGMYDSPSPTNRDVA